MPSTIFILRHEITRQRKEIENHPYVSYGLTAKLTDKDREIVETVEDITSQEDYAHSLLEKAIRNNVTPLCLRMFIENYMSQTD